MFLRSEKGDRPEKGNKPEPNSVFPELLLPNRGGCRAHLVALKRNHNGDEVVASSCLLDLEATIGSQAALMSALNQAAAAASQVVITRLHPHTAPHRLPRPARPPL